MRKGRIVSSEYLILGFLCFIFLTSSGKPITGPVQVGNFRMAPIGCGTWSWGNRFLWQYSQSDDNSLKETFNYVVNNGVNWFDTADSYGTGELEGRSESLLGEFLKQIPNRSQKNIYICTKLAPYPWRIGSQSMVNAASDSSNRLCRDIDMIQLHWPPSLGWQEKSYLSAFSEIVKNKKAVQIGLSNYGPKELRKVVKFVESKGQRVYSNQVQFSLLSRYPITTGLSETCEELGIQLIGYSSLALGLLADKYTIDKLPRGPRAILFREFLPSMKPLLDELRDVARQRKKTASQVALNWTLYKGALGLVGMRSVQQAKENLAAIGWTLTAAECDSLDKAAARVPKQLIQNSFQSQ